MTNSMDGKTVLLVGATGNFGRRLLRNLLAVEGIRVIAASRDEARAGALVAQVQRETGTDRVTAARFDSAGDVAAQLAQLKPWLVIDASGPFQAADYALAGAVLQAGAHLIDLADAPDYLLGFNAALDGLARQNGLVALSGASSTPALSTAVVRDLTAGWRRIDTVDMAIVPDGVGTVGVSAVQAVLTYAGEDVLQFRHGKGGTVTGWLKQAHVHIAGLAPRRVSDVETVDAAIMPQQFGVRSRVRFQAGLESNLEMRGLQLLAFLRSKRLLPKLKPLAKLLAAGRDVTRHFGTDKGGMIVRVTGIDGDGGWRYAHWSLVAHDGCGPNIPGLPAVAATRLLLGGALQAGARLADDIPLAHITRAFEALPIAVERFTRPEAPSPFQGLNMAAVPKAVQDFHRLEAPVEWAGLAQVERGLSLVSKLVGRIMGLPQPSTEVPVQVSIERQDDGAERWVRQFGTSMFHSVLRRDAKGCVWERFGPLNFALGLHVSDGKLHYPIRKGRAFGIPIPNWLLPSSETFETVDAAGRFCFDVRLCLPFFGLLVHYRGWLVAQER